MSAMATARVLLEVANDDAFPQADRSTEDLQAQLTELELDIALKRSGRWNLVMGR